MPTCLAEKDAAAAHHHVPKGEDGTSDVHTAIAKLINSILAGGNSVRRRQAAPEIASKLTSARRDPRARNLRIDPSAWASLAVLYGLKDVKLQIAAVGQGDVGLDVPHVT